VTRRTALPALVVAAALALSSCGGGSSSSEPATSGTGSSTSTHTSSGSSSSSGSSDVVEGVRLTPQSARLKLGDTARVSWQPNQKKTGVIAIRVTGLLKMPISAFSAWRLNRDTRWSTPYFVHATVRNLGQSDLSNVPVPLYLLDQRETLLQASTFRATFIPCPSRPLPPKFKHGDKASVCLVYFAPHHGKLVAISFRPTEDFDAITWEGQVVSGGARHKKKH
jgi:hypothetical protein